MAARGEKKKEMVREKAFNLSVIIICEIKLGT